MGRAIGAALAARGDTVVATLGRDAARTDVMALYEQLRVATEKEKRRRGVRVVDYDEDVPGHHGH